MLIKYCESDFCPWTYANDIVLYARFEDVRVFCTFLGAMFMHALRIMVNVPVTIIYPTENWSYREEISTATLGYLAITQPVWFEHSHLSLTLRLTLPWELRLPDPQAGTCLLHVRCKSNKWHGLGKWFLRHAPAFATSGVNEIKRERLVMNVLEGLRSAGFVR